MAYATLADVEKILPDSEDMPTEDSRDQHNLLAALEEATDLVIGFLKGEYTGDPTDEPGDMVPDDVPGAVRRVVARVAMRGFMSDNDNLGAESETQLMGPFSHALNWSREAQAGDFYLTNSDELRIERFIFGGAGGGAGHAPMYEVC